MIDLFISLVLCLFLQGMMILKDIRVRAVNAKDRHEEELRRLS